MNSDFILTLYSRDQTIFSLRELSLLFPETPYLSLKSQVNYFVRAGKLMTLRRGIYAKKNYNIKELAGKLYGPSYLSLETVLEPAGVVFQHYENIFVLSYLSRRVTIDSHEIFYRKISSEILMNKNGVENTGVYAAASKERAFLDAVFLYKDYHFDNLAVLDWNQVQELKLIYKSKALIKRVEQYYKDFKNA